MLNPYRHIAIFGLIGLCALVFAAEISYQTSWAEQFGAVPVEIVSAYRGLIAGNWNWAAFRKLSRLVTAVFLHGDAQHIAFNMVFLWTFGYLTSEILGQWRAVAIFLICGVAGNVVQVCLNTNSASPIIGASGAICGFEGVYLGLALQWRLPYAEVWPLAHPVPPIQLAAFALIGFVGDMILLARHDQHIAYGAHLGGLLTGVVSAGLVTAIYPTVESYHRTLRHRH